MLWLLLGLYGPPLLVVAILWRRAGKGPAHSHDEGRRRPGQPCPACDGTEVPS